MVPHLDAADEARIIQGFNEQRTSEYAEIIEECETKFQKEIEFEHFRQNYTFEEAEEIQQDLDKIRRWYERVRERDWFGAARADEVERWLDKCQELLNGFTEEVHRRSQDGPTAALGDADGSSELAVDSGSELPPVVSPLPLGRRKRPSQSNGGA